MGFAGRLRSSVPIDGAGVPAAMPSVFVGSFDAEPVGQRSARFERTRPHLHRTFQQRARLGGFPAMGEDGGELEVGVEIVGVGGQFFAEGLGGAIGIAREEQCLAVVGLERGHGRIQGGSFRKLRDCTRIVARREQSGAQQEVPLRRIAAAQDAVHAQLAFGDAAVADQRHSEDVVEGRLIGLRRFQRGQQVDGVLEFAGSQAAIGEQQREVQVRRLGAVQGFEFGGCFGDLERLVVGQREVEAKAGGDIGGGYLQGRLILIDGILIAPQFDQHGAQVGARLDAVGLGGNAGPVFAHGACKIPSLMQLNGMIEGTSGGPRLPRQSCDQQGETQTIRQRSPLIPRTKILAPTGCGGSHHVGA